MKVTILGSGSAYGVPYFGGNWGKCDAMNPKNRRSTASILIEDSDTRVLVDMGYDLLRQSEKHNIRLLDGVIFTHTHADHIIGNFHVPIMMEYYQDRDLPFYTDAFTRAGIEKMWWFQYNPEAMANFYGPGRPVWNEFKAFDRLKIGSMEIETIPQEHGSMTSYGLRIGNFCYSTDLSSIPTESFQRLTGLDIWVVECDSLLPSESHSHLEKTLEWIAQVKPKQAYLTHLDHTIDYEKISAILPDNVALAYDDQIIVL